MCDKPDVFGAVGKEIPLQQIWARSYSMDKKTKMYSVGYATFSLASFSMSSHVVNKTYSTQ